MIQVFSLVLSANSTETPADFGTYLVLVACQGAVAEVAFWANVLERIHLASICFQIVEGDTLLNISVFVLEDTNFSKPNKCCSSVPYIPQGWLSVTVERCFRGTVIGCLEAMGGADAQANAKPRCHQIELFRSLSPAVTILAGLFICMMIRVEKRFRA